VTRRDPFGQPGRPARAAASAADQLAGELAPGEELLWGGGPDNSGWLYREDLLLLPFSLLWGGFAIFWEANAASEVSGPGPGWFFVLWGIPFVVMGVYLIVGRLFYRRWARSRCVYGVTDRRVLSLTRSWRGETRVRVLWLASYPPVAKHVGRGGTGSIDVGAMAAGRRQLGGLGSWPSALGRRVGAADEAIVLSDIDDASRVYELITQQIAATSANAGAPSG
jgi:hypothetical protein